MKKGNMIAGIILIAIGGIWLVNSSGIASIDLFFDGWWALLWTIPCLIGLFTEKEKLGNLIGVVAGILVILGCQNIIDFKFILKLILPVAVILLGILIIFKDVFNKKTKSEIKRLNQGDRSKKETNCAIFSSREISYENRVFEGINTEVVFGGIELDLSNAVINQDCVINADAIFGGIDIKVPDYVNIKTSATSIFGGLSDKRTVRPKDCEHTIYINATCLLGGIDLLS